MGIGNFWANYCGQSKEQLVIVQWSTWPVAHPAEDGQPLEASLVFNAINNYLNK